MANALGCERYVPTQMRFGKARERSFPGFITVKTRHSMPNRPGLSGLARTCAKAQFPGQGSGGEPPRTSHCRTRAKAVDDACSSCRGPQTKSNPGDTRDGYIRFCG